MFDSADVPRIGSIRRKFQTRRFGNDNAVVAKWFFTMVGPVGSKWQYYTHNQRSAKPTSPSSGKNFRVVPTCSIDDYGVSHPFAYARESHVVSDTRSCSRTVNPAPRLRFNTTPVRRHHKSCTPFCCSILTRGGRRQRWFACFRRLPAFCPLAPTSCSLQGFIVCAPNGGDVTETKLL